MACEKHPSFENPPVIETVLGVQFDRLEGFRNAHLGAFWKTLEADWVNLADAPTLEPAFEEFGEGQVWGALGQLKLTQYPSSRLQIRNEAADRMIQLQNGRLHYNWLRQSEESEGLYPRYRILRPEFDDVLRQFQEFLANEQLGPFSPNQWEVTYVNHLPKGTVWKTPSDWGSVFVGLPGPFPQFDSPRLESFTAEWHFEIEPQQGRLHVHVAHARLASKAGQEILRLTLTARGAVAGEGTEGLDVNQGLNLGRSTIVNTFRNITSQIAHDYWRPIHDNA